MSSVLISIFIFNASDQFFSIHVLLSFSFISLLMRLLLDAPTTVDSQNQFVQFAGRMISEIIIPNIVWRGGRYELKHFIKYLILTHI